jgi:CrcB protein
VPSEPSDQDAVVDSDVDLGDPAQVAEVKAREWDILAAVGIGGVIGAQARYGLGRALPHGPSALPWSTVLINASGCLAIGILMAILLAQASPPRLARPFLGVGILGGYTTYSSFATDTIALLDRHRPALAAAYLAITVVSCALAVWLGNALTRRVVGDRP